eukprot:598803-Rhodomonas_salina.1
MHGRVGSEHAECCRALGGLPSCLQSACARRLVCGQARRRTTERDSVERASGSEQRARGLRKARRNGREFLLSATQFSKWKPSGVCAPPLNSD